MAAKAVREHYGKQLLARHFGAASNGEFEIDARGILVKAGVKDPASGESWDSLLAANPWAKDTKLVAKPDQLIKRRGKAGLVYVNKTFDECRAWVDERMNKTVAAPGRDRFLAAGPVAVAPTPRGLVASIPWSGRADVMKRARDFRAGRRYTSPGGGRPPRPRPGPPGA